MSIEIEGLEPENTVETGTAAEPTPYETRALEMGWRPKEEFDGNEDDFVEAKEYVQRAPLFEKIRSVTKRLEKQEQVAQELLKLNSRIEETAYQRALSELKAKQKEALNDGDLQEYHAINEQIEKVKEDKPVAVKAAPSTQVPTEFVEWSEKNPWYDKNEAMTAYADRVGQRLRDKFDSYDALLNEIAKQVKAEFPDKFKNPNRDRTGVEANSGRAPRNSKEVQLNDQERRIMNTFVSTGVMTKEAYIEQLRRAKGE